MVCRSTTITFGVTIILVTDWIIFLLLSFSSTILVLHVLSFQCSSSWSHGGTWWTNPFFVTREICYLQNVLSNDSVFRHPNTDAFYQNYSQLRNYFDIYPQLLLHKCFKEGNLEDATLFVLCKTPTFFVKIFWGFNGKCFYMVFLACKCRKWIFPRLSPALYTLCYYLNILSSFVSHFLPRKSPSTSTYLKNLD